MDAVQFGRWLGERRHAGGWPSQRALAEAARELPETRGAALSEAFLARLEAGHLAHPFRGLVRQRVLALGWLLCKSARDVRGYLRAAGLTELSREETARVEQWMRRLDPARSAGMAVLPPRPARLLGRENELAEVLRALTADGEAVVAITGMPGAGKSALAAELAHRLAERELDGPATFPDGIVWISATGQRGARGLADMLDTIAALLSGAHADAEPRTEGEESAPGHNAEAADRTEATSAPTPAQVSARVAERTGARAALGDRRLLVVLDGVDAAFPLEAAVAALLARNAGHAGAARIAGRGGADEPGARGGHRAILLTSRYRPAPALLSAHLHLGALAPEAALALFATLLGHSLTDGEQDAAKLIGAAVGHLPVAIAAATTAVAARGIALPLLAARVSARPLDGLLDGDGELRALLARALEPLPEASRERFALLGALGAPSFGLEPVAALRTELPSPRPEQSLPTPRGARMAAVLRDALAVLREDAASGDSSGGAVEMGDLALAADGLGHLVRHSLLDATPLPAVAPHRGDLGDLGEVGGERMPPGGQTHYATHPLLMAYAVERLEQLDPAVAQAARQSVREYALAFVERHHNEPRVLERERDLLLAVLTRAWGEADYAVVVRLVAGLWHLVSRVGSPALTARALAWGISASQHLDDQYHLARFLGRLGSLRYYHGEPDQARQAWEASLEIAEQLRGPSELWYPLASLAMLACAEGDFLHAQRYAEAYLRRAERDGGIPAVAGALFKRGLGAHLAGDLDQAYADLNACTRLLALRGAGDKIAHDGIFEMAAQAELARVQGDFARAQHHMEIAVALAEEVCDHYVVADLLLDQARFARLQERQEEARVLARRVVEVATRVEAHQLRLEGLRLLRQLPEAANRLSS